MGFNFTSNLSNVSHEHTQCSQVRQQPSTLSQTTAKSCCSRSEEAHTNIQSSESWKRINTLFLQIQESRRCCSSAPGDHFSQPLAGTALVHFLGREGRKEIGTEGPKLLQRSRD